MTPLLPRISCLVLCVLCAARGLWAEMSSADAIAVLLNSRNAVGVRTFAAAREVVARDAQAGKPLQQFVLGVTSPEDRELSARYLDASREKIRQLAERKGNPLAWYLLSLERNDFTCLKKAAEGGNVQALNALGSIVTQEALARSQISSNALESLLRKSYGYFRQAAIRRDPNGFINLGTCYLRGFGCRRDMGLAFVCFKAAADAGHPEGMDNVSACYQFGHGVEKDAELSLLWAMRGRAARGDEAAAKWLRERK